MEISTGIKLFGKKETIEIESIKNSHNGRFDEKEIPSYQISVKTNKGLFTFEYNARLFADYLSPNDLVLAFEQHLIDACCYDIFKDYKSIMLKFNVTYSYATKMLRDFKKANENFEKYFKSNIMEISSMIERAKEKLGIK